jgi:hypothetical protein
VDRGLTPEDVVTAVEQFVPFDAESSIVRSIRAAPTRDEAIEVARHECSTGVMRALASISRASTIT